ncbi:substrate-binding domain-containing protein, partial [Streptomyces ardesiacus]
VFCYNDLLAIGAMHTLARAGVRVPEDIAVVGVDGIQEGRYSSPSLTTVAPDKAAIARTAVSTLLGVIDGSAPAPTDAKAPHRLLVRQSTRGAPVD